MRSWPERCGKCSIASRPLKSCPLPHAGEGRKESSDQAIALRDPLPDHQAVFRAIAARDTAAARATMMELLRLALADMHIALVEPAAE